MDNFFKKSYFLQILTEKNLPSFGKKNFPTYLSTFKLLIKEKQTIYKPWPN